MKQVFWCAFKMKKRRGNEIRQTDQILGNYEPRNQQITVIVRQTRSIDLC